MIGFRADTELLADEKTERSVSDWRDEEARARGVFRDVNERARELHRVSGEDGRGVSFVCECGNGACTQAITLKCTEYEAVRAHPRRFLIAPNHENPEIERVVDENGLFAVVETFVGEASRIAEETDPRASVSG
jgi:hypothetical protein